MKTKELSINVLAPLLIILCALKMNKNSMQAPHPTQKSEPTTAISVADSESNSKKIRTQKPTLGFLNYLSIEPSIDSQPFMQAEHNLHTNDFNLSSNLTFFVD